MTVICHNLLQFKDPSIFVENMKMFEIFLFEVVTKHVNLCLPYLGVIRILQSVFISGNKNIVN